MRTTTCRNAGNRVGAGASTVGMISASPASSTLDNRFAWRPALSDQLPSDLPRALPHGMSLMEALRDE
jgi:hypothetical protein